MSKTLEDFSMVELQAMSKDLDNTIQEARKRLKAVNKEMAFRDHADQRMKALQGLTPAEIARLQKLAQTVSPASIASGEAVGKPQAS